jgi:hypothetical protein
MNYLTDNLVIKQERLMNYNEYKDYSIQEKIGLIKFKCSREIVVNLTNEIIEPYEFSFKPKDELPFITVQEMIGQKYLFIFDFILLRNKVMY